MTGPDRAWRAVVLGQVARDLVLAVDALPEGGASAVVRQRRELLGGKGANQALACLRLGLDAAVIGVVGDDDAGRDVLARARADGLDVDDVVRRDGSPTALLTDVVEADGTRRLLEDVPPGTLLTAADVRASSARLATADAVLLQLQQPRTAVLEALRTAVGAGALVVADGAPPDDDVRDELAAHAHVLRADAAETAALVGHEPAGVEETVEAAHALRSRGPVLVALAAGQEENVVVWDGGHVVMPLLEGPVTDPTGAGDAFTAALAAGLLHGRTPEETAWWASAAAVLAVGTLGGRPSFDLTAVRERAERARAAAG
ncbi:PfkB family carbohydrate kinase [Cellulosimicrobium cellulans]|uniref:PfkB family carbohydrate kinase n=1 Tax=Cellulosimicrobium cellulans TaxID=1710 RepID=UPI000848CC45|nr:PfkB family carbohydrate kinase [Cellulosimicrobium cellulans]